MIITQNHNFGFLDMCHWSDLEWVGAMLCKHDCQKISDNLERMLET